MRTWIRKHTRLLNVLHWLRLSDAHSQMIDSEKESLKKYAFEKKNALEIGTYMGVTAVIIARSIDKNGRLYCVDPFLDRFGKNPGLSIAERGLRRAGVEQKVVFLKGFSSDKIIISQIPDDLDFVLVDGDHSYEGLKNDWAIVRNKLKPNGLVCLHDTIIPPEEPYRYFGSVDFFNEVITKDSEFEIIDRCYSMTILRRLPK